MTENYDQNLEQSTQCQESTFSQRWSKSKDTRAWLVKVKVKKIGMKFTKQQVLKISHCGTRKWDEVYEGAGFLFLINNFTAIYPFKLCKCIIWFKSKLWTAGKSNENIFNFKTPTNVLCA